MSEQTPASSSAMKPFVGGLILGLLIGGLAGAYLSAFTETSIPKFKPSAVQPAPRDERPAMPEAPPADPAPPASPTPSQPK